MWSSNYLEKLLKEPFEIQEVIHFVMAYLKTQPWNYYNGHLFIIEQPTLKDYRFSTSIIQVSSQTKDRDYLHDYVLDQLDKKQVIETIIRAINHICLQEDKDVFIERFLYRKRIEQIKQKHCLSNNGYYQCLNRAMNDCYQYLMWSIHQ